MRSLDFRLIFKVVRNKNIAFLGNPYEYIQKSSKLFDHTSRGKKVKTSTPGQMFLVHGSDNCTHIHHIDFSVGDKLFFAGLDFVYLEVAWNTYFDHTIIFVKDIVNDKLTFD